MDIFYNMSRQYTVDEDNCRINALPLLRFKEQPWWNIHLFKGDGYATADLSGVVSARAAVDIDLASATSVMCRSTRDQIDLSRTQEGVVSVRLNANTAEFLSKVDGKENVNAKFELWGYDSSGAVELYVCFNIRCSAVVDPEGGTPPEPVENDPVIRESELEARIARKLIMEYSSDGIESHQELLDGDEFYRLRHGTNGEPSDWQPLLYGPSGSGEDGTAATIAIGSVTDVEYDDEAAVENVGTENAAVLNFRLRAGKPGKDGEPGKDGSSFVIDATGELSERGVYDGEPAGFVFAAVVNDEEARTATWYFYKKRSNAFGDWYDPLTKVEYGGRDGDNAKLIPCVEFTAPAGILDGTRYLSFSLKDYPGAWVSAVIIDTAKGEEQLPFYHDQGIRQIYKQSGTFYLYFGANVPAFETGRIYFAQGVTPERDNDGISSAVTPIAPIEFSAPGSTGYFFINVSDFPDASIANVTIDTEEGELTLPYFHDAGVSKIVKNDEKIYIHFGANVPAFETGRIYLSRMVAAGSANQPGSGTVSGNMYYGVIHSTTMTNITQVTADELSASSVITEPASAIGKVDLGEVPSGSWIIALLPSGLSARKDDGFGGKTGFAENNAAPSTGANGQAVDVDGNSYYVYGEFVLATGRATIYIEDM